MRQATKLTSNVIVDSSALVALLNAEDGDHTRAKAVSETVRQGNYNLLVPRDIFIETLNVVSKKVNRQTALSAAVEIRSSGPFLVVDAEGEVVQDALKKWATQPSSVSLTDCIVMACADHFETKAIFGFDEVFRKNGYQLPKGYAVEKAA